jgi:hypothetical protein
MPLHGNEAPDTIELIVDIVERSNNRYKTKREVQDFRPEYVAEGVGLKVRRFRRTGRET